MRCVCVCWRRQQRTEGRYKRKRQTVRGKEIREEIRSKEKKHRSLLDSLVRNWLEIQEQKLRRQTLQGWVGWQIPLGFCSKLTVNTRDQRQVYYVWDSTLGFIFWVQFHTDLSFIARECFFHRKRTELTPHLSWKSKWLEKHPRINCLEGYGRWMYGEYNKTRKSRDGKRPQERHSFIKSNAFSWTVIWFGNPLSYQNYSCFIRHMLWDVFSLTPGVSNTRGVHWFHVSVMFAVAFMGSIVYFSFVCPFDFFLRLFMGDDVILSLPSGQLLLSIYISCPFVCHRLLFESPLTVWGSSTCCELVGFRSSCFVTATQVSCCNHVYFNDDEGDLVVHSLTTTTWSVSVYEMIETIEWYWHSLLLLRGEETLFFHDKRMRSSSSSLFFVWKGQESSQQTQLSTKGKRRSLYRKKTLKMRHDLLILLFFLLEGP